MQKAPVLKGSGLAPIDDETANVHVFGKNLEERVVACQHEEQDEEEKKKEATSNNEAPNEPKPGDDDVETIKKRKFETITGEEDEETAFQGDFKLFAWDISTSNWNEKGRGQLKLNDKLDVDGRKSRLIMRTGGTYRIILNVAIQHPTFRVIANTKTNIRFTDSQNVWAASGSNAMQLGDIIVQRLKIDALNHKATDLQSHHLNKPQQANKIEERSEDDQKDKVDEEDEKVVDQSKETAKQEQEQEEKVNDKSNNTNENCDRVDSPSEENQNNKSEDQKIEKVEDQVKEKDDQSEEVDDHNNKIESPTRNVEGHSKEAEDQVEEETKAPISEEVKEESTKIESRNDDESTDDRDYEQHETKKRKAE